MLNNLLDLSLFGDALAALAYAVFTLYFTWKLCWRRSVPAHVVSYVFLSALGVSTTWAALSWLTQWLRLPIEVDVWLIPLADWLRYALWLGFIVCSCVRQMAGLGPQDCLGSFRWRFLCPWFRWPFCSRVNTATPGCLGQSCSVGRPLLLLWLRLWWA